ncbi:hypothetical protein [Faecalibacter bovis]|uniref:PH domain-containing protein n=1 Tax=Faecalibacter bovis TaxID=2898187 RepID=A0ABX7XB08_9FLAO|nr:hypothetical protein [Faecalibacter bovis]QTV05063.1 hypothetical protein J9309_09705 [Faecalibacter bovis]
MNQKEYNFKYSKSLLNFEFLSVIITFGLSAYLYFEKENKTLAIILLIIGISNSIYYITRITNKKIQLKINSKGIYLKNKFISWNAIDEIQIDRNYSGNISSEFLTIITKSGKDYNLEISELNVNSKKLKLIISNFKK